MPVTSLTLPLAESPCCGPAPRVRDAYVRRDALKSHLEMCLLQKPWVYQNYYILYKVMTISMTILSGCGGVLHSNNGTIRSPHWPQNFPENSRCSWTVITHQSKHLEISFDNNFLIPSGDGQCQNSFVKVSVLVYLIGAKLVSGT